MKRLEPTSSRHSECLGAALLMLGAAPFGAFAENNEAEVVNGRYSASSMQVQSRVHEGVTLKTSFLPDLAFDGDETTRWGSAFKDDQWIAVDLERGFAIETLEVIWSDKAFAEAYDVLVSDDGRTWTKIHARDGKKNGDPDSIALETAASGRHVKVFCKRRSSKFGFSIHEIRVNGKTIAELTLPPVPLDAPYRDANADPKTRAKDLVGRMTFAEKMLMTGGTDHMYLPALARFDLPRIRLTDASAGIRIKKGTPNPIDTTAFPAPITLAASWDPSLAYEYAKAIGEECRGFGYGILLGPGVNIYRVSQNGRNFEYFGEDPYLTSRTAVGYVKGLQDQGVLATVKHFIADQNEFIRHEYNAVIDDRTMHEIYLPAFKAAIQEADAKAVMTAYNYVNGQDAGEQHETIKKLLREEIGFEGLVMTDWGGYEDVDMLLTSGQNLMMPSNRRFAKYWTEHLREHPEDRERVEKELERMVFRIFAALFDMGVYDREAFNADYAEKFASHKAVARRVGEAGVTLLKNDGVLPLRPEAYRNVLLAGDDERYAGGGSATVKGYDVVSYQMGMKKLFGEENVTYVEDPTPAQIQAADLVICRVLNHGMEGSDSPFEVKEKTAETCVEYNPNTIILAAGGKGMAMPWLDQARAVLFTYYLGQEAGNAIGNVLSGAVNPSGKLPFTIEKKFEDSFAFGYNFLEETGEYHLTSKVDQIEKRLKPGKKLKLPHDIVYDEGIFVGYRWYDKERVEPRFPFGFGLSYTTFAYDDLKVTPVEAKNGPLARVTFTLTNTGDRAGAEVAQLYVRDVESSVERPEKELKGYKKLFLEPGETREIELFLSREDLSFWDVVTRAWTAEKGSFEILVGTSSREIELTGSYELR